MLCKSTSEIYIFILDMKLCSTFLDHFKEKEPITCKDMLKNKEQSWPIIYLHVANNPSCFQ